MPKFLVKVQRFYDAVVEAADEADADYEAKEMHEDDMEFTDQTVDVKGECDDKGNLLNQPAKA